LRERVEGITASAFMAAVSSMSRIMTTGLRDDNATCGHAAARRRSLIEKLGQIKADRFDVREPVCQCIEQGHHPLLSRIALNCSTCNESVGV